MVTSCGILFYRQKTGKIEVLLVHPSGNPQSPFGIPKGNIDKSDADHIATAKREVLEETGIVAPAKIHPLGEVYYKNHKKKVIAFYAEADAQKPRCASWEIDVAEFFDLDKAQKIIHNAQAEFLSKLKKLLS